MRCECLSSCTLQPWPISSEIRDSLSIWEMSKGHEIQSKIRQRVRGKTSKNTEYMRSYIAFRILLASVFQLFSMPRLSKWYEEGLQNYITPYLYPIMQTSLTTSVYMTVVIAVYAFVYIKPVPKGPEDACNDESEAKDEGDDDPTMQMNPSSEVETQYEFNHPGFGTDSRKTVYLTIFSVMAFGLVFNAPRWLEIQRTDTLQWDEETNSNITKPGMRFTELRKNPIYVRWYGLIGSTIVMILLPVLILVTTYISLCRTIPKGSTKKRTVSIVVVIIFMFIICHLPKAFLTGYEIIYMGSDKSESMSKWPNSFKAMNEVNTFLLVAYSALNPFAYCGKLIFTELENGLGKCSRYTKTICYLLRIENVRDRSSDVCT